MEQHGSYLVKLFTKQQSYLAYIKTGRKIYIQYIKQRKPLAKFSINTTKKRRNSKDWKQP
jgi:hypothetical protein